MVSDYFPRSFSDKVEEVLNTEKGYTDKNTKNLNSINILLSAFLNEGKFQKEFIELMKCLKGFEAQTLIIDKILDNPKTENKEMRIIVGFILQSIMTSKFLENLDKIGISLEDKIKLLNKWNETLKHIYIGQGIDFIYTCEKVKPINLEEYLLMIKETTSPMISLSLYIGCLIKKFNDNQIKKIMEYGINIGLAFQIKDDFEDFENDVFEGKQRVFIIKEALSYLPQEKQKFIIKFYRENPKKCIKLIKNSKIHDYVINLNNQYVDKALKNLED